MTAMPAMAERYIVLNNTNHTQYKGDTETLPTLQPGEWVMFAPNINDIQKNAWWNGAAFVNPLPAMEPEERTAIKNDYQQAITDLNSIKDNASIIRNQTQTDNIRKLADNDYRFADILIEMLRFLKQVFWT